MKKYAFLAILFGALTFISCDSKGGSSSSSDDKTEKSEKSKDDKDKDKDDADDSDDSKAGSSITGTWKVDNSSVMKMLGDDTDEITSAEMRIHFDENRMDIIMDATGESDGMSISFTIKCNFSYTLVDDVICCVYKSCDADLTDLDLPYEIEAQLEEQGMDTEDFMEMMQDQFIPQMKKEASKNFGDNFEKITIKNLNGDRMTLESEDGTIKLTRL